MQVFLVMETIIFQGPLNPTEGQNDLNLDHSFIQSQVRFVCVRVCSWGGQQTAVISLEKLHYFLSDVPSAAGVPLYMCFAKCSQPSKCT